MDRDNIQAVPNSSIEELSGKLEFNSMDNKLMHSVLDNDKRSIDDGKLIENGINAGIGAFTPDLLYDRFVKNYQLTKNLTGPSILRLLTGYEPGYIKRNMKIPEFAQKVKSMITKKCEEMRQEGLLDEQGAVTEKAIELSSLVTLLEELDDLHPQGEFGERFHKKRSIQGDPYDIKPFSSSDRFRDLSARKTLRIVARRGRQEIAKSDIRVLKRNAKGTVSIIFALDASSSMKGDKLMQCKRAGISLGFNATQNKDEVGLLVFGTDVKAKVTPTKDFSILLKEIISARAAQQTNMTDTIRIATEMLADRKSSKHIILLTDSKPTTGKKPKEDVLSQISKARSMDITFSLVGIGLDKEATDFSKKMVELGGGRFYQVKKTSSISSIILEEYLLSQ